MRENKINKFLCEDYHKQKSEPAKNKIMQTTFESYIERRFVEYVWDMGLELGEKWFYIETNREQPY